MYNTKFPICICTNKILWHNDTYSHILHESRSSFFQRNSLSTISWKIGLYLDWSRLVTSHRLFMHLEHRFGILCVYINIRLLSWQIIIYSCYGIFYALFERLECLTSAREMTQKFFLQFVRYSNLGSKLLFFMFKNCCVTVNVENSWKIFALSLRYL